MNSDFKEGFANDGFYGLSSQESFNPVTTVSSAYKVQPSLWCSSLDQRLSTGTHPYPNSFEEPSGSPNKKKKKHKKKKHKHYEDGDTSGTGGESNATTPAACGGTTPNKVEDNCLSPASTYGVVKVNADTKKLSLKIFKRPANDGSQPVFTVEHLGGGGAVKKEKKTKRNKDKDRERRNHRETHSKSDPPSSPMEMHIQQTMPLPVELAIKTHNTLTSSSPVITTTNNDSCKSVRPILPAFTHPMSKDPSQLDLSLITSESLFENLSSMNNLYQQPQSQSTSSLPSTPVSFSGDGKTVVSSSCGPSTCVYSTSDTSQVNSFTSKSNIFYELLRNSDSATTLRHMTDSVPSDMIMPSSSSASNAISSVCNMMDFASSFLQNEMLSSNSSYVNFPLGITSLATCDSATVLKTSFPLQQSSTNASFLVTSHLLDSSQSSVVTAADSTLDVFGWHTE
ncbi:unnamed protein product [Heterobilharzia americana]|nr:unnamed protein product [Heterobilharzia americana]